MKRSWVIKFITGPALFFGLALLVLGISQMGDCFGDVEACAAAKHHDGDVVFLISGLIYVAGATVIIWRWSRH